MEIKGKIHCFFEQSGTFKNEFKKLGYDAFDYDIQNNFNETDFVIDLFAEIEKGYNGESSIFDTITSDDLILAFSLGCTNYRKLSKSDAMRKIIERAKNRYEIYDLLLKLVAICFDRNLRMIFENPWNEQHYLKQGNFPQNPSYVDKDRTRRGDNFVKPTAYWFVNCEPTKGFTYQQTRKENVKSILSARGGARAGLCSEERSMISPDYARNFICDNILGITQKLPNQQLTLF